MAQSSPGKVQKRKVSNYSSCLLSDSKLAQQMLAGLSIATCDCSIEDEPAAFDDAIVTGSGDGDERVTHTVSTRMSCGCCAVEFSVFTEQRAHFKSDWHRYNLKCQLKGENSVTEDIFEAMSGDISSISGSGDSSDSSSDTEDPTKPILVPARLKQSACDSTDSESDENYAVLAAIRKHPKLFLRNDSGQLVSLYRCILYHKKNAPTTQAELLSMVNQALNYTCVAVIMLAGGHFAAAVFDGKEAMVHKTFHRYVVRAKRGTVQSVRDNQGNAPKSGGAVIRRYNEAALALEIQELLTSWAEHMKNCHLIFLRVSTYNKQIFFGGKFPVLDKNDLRIRTIPFSTCRPTFNEVKRVHQMLTSVECYGDEASMVDFVPMSPPRRINRESGQLEVRLGIPERQSPLRRKDKNAAADAVPEDDNCGTENPMNEDNAPDVEESKGEIELVEMMTEIQTQDLKEFDIYVPGKNKKKKKKGSKKTDSSNSVKAPKGRTSEAVLAEADLKNRLYTACKCGDLSQLLQLLSQLQVSGPQGQSNSNVTENYANNSENCVTRSNQDSVSFQSVPHHPVMSEQSCNVTVVSVKEGIDFHVHNRGEREVSESTANGCEPGCENTKTDEMALSVAFTQTVKLSDNTSNTQTPHTVSGQVNNHKSGGADELKPHWLLNEGYGEKRSTLLHLASIGGHSEVVHALLVAGCDPAAKDASGKLPYALATSKETRNAFRRFRGSNPDMYNYDDAQVPSALTDELEAEKKQREAERKKAQRKARQERLKDKKAEESKLAAEQREKEKFLALSDREKRALAAERRLLQQASSQGKAPPVISRCFQCAADMTGKVPFEYMDYKFCTTKCLREHRAKNAQ